MMNRDKLTVLNQTYGPFQENTYLIHDSNQHAIVIDPGMSNSQEQESFLNWLNFHNLKLHAVLNTHCHIDHVMGNAFVKSHFDIPLYYDKRDEYNLDRAIEMSRIWGINYTPSPLADGDLSGMKEINFEGIQLDIWYIPGHCIGHLGFMQMEEKWGITGDVLFHEGIGRTDLPGGDIDVLKNSVEKLYGLPQDFILYPGHGIETNIGHELEHNPFFSRESLGLL
jgi:glyoxylase-like metal-dependent hydrolase (beta-lactamase superfamily II)